MKKKFLVMGGTPWDTDYRGFILELSSRKAQNTSDLLELAKRAIHEYATTDEGCAEWADNSHCFDWGDVANVAGTEAFKKACTYVGVHITIHEYFEIENDEILDIQETLMDEFSVKVVGVKWDIDPSEGEEDPGDLPRNAVLEGVKPDSDIADMLSDKYGYFVQSFRDLHAL